MRGGANGVRAAAIVLLGAACAHQGAPRPAPDPLPAPVLESAPSRGVVGLEFVADPGASQPRLGAHQEYVPPRLRYAPLPPYPAEALARRAPPATVVVRITIDERGDIANVCDSPVATAAEREAPAEFRAAAARTARRWGFAAAHIDDVRDGRDLDGDGKPDYTVLVKTHPIRVFVDIRFRFAVVDGVGTVDTSAAPAST